MYLHKSKYNRSHLLIRQCWSVDRIQTTNSNFNYSLLGTWNPDQEASPAISFRGSFSTPKRDAISRGWIPNAPPRSHAVLPWRSISPLRVVNPRLVPRSLGRLRVDCWAWLFSLGPPVGPIPGLSGPVLSCLQRSSARLVNLFGLVWPC